jgi:hypothetical protein
MPESGLAGAATVVLNCGRPTGRALLTYPFPGACKLPVFQGDGIPEAVANGVSYRPPGWQDSRHSIWR